MLSNNILESPWRITFDTNPDQCNLNCIMCEEHSLYNNNRESKNRIMNFDLIEKVIKEMAGKGLKEIIPSTMGEPLLYKHFNKLISLIDHYGLKLNLTTNGTFPIFDTQKWANLILPIASDIKISINGSKKQIAEKIMRGLSFKNQITNIRILIENRDKMIKKGINNPSISFQVTFMEKNLENLPDLLKLAIDLNINRFKGHHLWITNENMVKESLKKDQDSINQWNNIVDRLNRIAQELRLKNGEKIILDNIYKLNNNEGKLLIPSDFICPFLGREAWIAWDGTFNVCCAPNDLREKFGYFGNVNTNKFLDLWTAAKYHQLIENWGENEVCINCNMRKPKAVLGGP